MRVKANSVLCLQCGKWIHCRCAIMKRLIRKFSRNYACRKCDGNIGKAVEQEENVCDEMETVKELTYLGDRVSTGGGCKTDVTARTRSGWVKPRECVELLHGSFPLNLKEAVYKSCLRPAILHGSEVWCLKESEMGTDIQI